MREADLLNWPQLARPADALVGWRERPTQTALQPVDNASFLREVQAWRAQLAQVPGRRYALFHADTLCFAAALFGAWLAGKTIYLPADALPDTCRALATEVDGFLGEFDSHWQALATPAANPSSIDWTPLAPDFPGLVVYTSGSTGQAQAIPKTLAQMANEVATLEQLFGPRLGQAEILATVSHQHIYGLLFKVLWPLASGRPVHARSAFFPEDLRRMVPPRRWALLSSPAHLKRLHEQPVLPDTSRLCAVFSSGGPLLAEAARQAHAVLGHCAIEVYGSSETGGIAWRSPHADPALRDERWQAMPGVQVRASADGLLEVCSPHLPDQAWFAMADRVQLADAGFTLHGRADRIVKLEEKRISLDRIEALLLASGLASEARVILHEGRRQRQFIAAFVVPSNAGQDVLASGKQALNAALRTALAQGIEGVALPRLWRYLDAMPVNAQGKLTVAALSALLEKTGSELPMAPARPTQPQVREITRTTEHVVLSLHVPPDLLYFDGHFDQAPVLPGVVQTDWALALGRRYFSLPPRFAGMQALKFQRVITPGTTVTLELRHDTARGSLAFTLHSEGGQHASGRFVLEAA